MVKRTALSTKASDPIIGLFNDRRTARRAYLALFNYGYTQGEITVAMSDEIRKIPPLSVESELQDKTLEGLGAGMIIGAGVGALVGAIAGVGTSLIVPGLGMVIAGPLATGLTGAGAGGVACGLIGA